MTKAEAEQLFGYTHLPPHLQEVSAPFYSNAMNLFDAIPERMSDYRDDALKRLWDAKNWAVAAVAQQ